MVVVRRRDWLFDFVVVVVLDFVSGVSKIVLDRCTLHHELNRRQYALDGIRTSLRLRLFNQNLLPHAIKCVVDDAHYNGH